MCVCMGHGGGGNMNMGTEVLTEPEVSSPPGAELQAIGSCWMGCGNQIQVLWRNSTGF